jgi:hypothetical protein
MLEHRFGELGSLFRGEFKFGSLSANKILEVVWNIRPVREFKTVELIVIGVRRVAELGIDRVPFFRRRVGFG